MTIQEGEIRRVYGKWKTELGAGEDALMIEFIDYVRNQRHEPINFLMKNTMYHGEIWKMEINGIIVERPVRVLGKGPSIKGDNIGWSYSSLSAVENDSSPNPIVDEYPYFENEDRTVYGPGYNKRYPNVRLEELEKEYRIMNTALRKLLKKYKINKDFCKAITYRLEYRKYPTLTTLRRWHEVKKPLRIHIGLLAKEEYDILCKQKKYQPSGRNTK
jgi:hypothetical protein